MALIDQTGGTTTKTLATRDPQCHTCKARKPGLFTMDANGRPQCADCAAAVGKPIPAKPA